MKRILLIVALLVSCAYAQTTTITGTIKDLTNTIVTSGKVTFTLTPNRDTTISGIARFTPTTVTCLINASGLIKAQDGTSTCTLTMNTALSPSGTYYTVAVWPYNVKTSNFNFYAVLSTYDWSTVVPTPTTSPAQNFVDTFSNQSIAGTKTFTDSVVLSGTETISGSVTSAILNGAYVPSVCAGSPVPSWCSGSDMGGWINAAIQALPGHCGTVYISPGTYSFSTTLIKPRCVKVDGAGQQATTLNWTASTGVAIIVADSQSSTNYPNGEISDLTLSCSTGSGSPTIGIYYGGSTGVGNAPSTLIDPATNYGDHEHLNRVKVIFCGVNVQYGNNAWANVISESTLTSAATNLYFPSGSVTNSGEAISIIGSDILNATGDGILIDTNNSVGLLDLTIVGGKIDYNGGWAIHNCTANCLQAVHVQGTHIETPAKWVQNFGYFSASGTKFTNGSSSGTLGYLFDTANTKCTIVGGEMLNAGGGTLFNSANQICSLFMVSWSGPGIGPVTFAQNPATIVAAGLLGASFVQAGGFTANGGGACGAGNVALGAGWGTGATATAFSGFSQTCQFTITSGGAAFGAAPTVTFTLPTQYSGTVQPCQLNVHAITGAGGAIMFDNTTPSASAPVFTATTTTGAAFTPAVTETYKVVLSCGP